MSIDVSMSVRELMGVANHISPESREDPEIVAARAEMAEIEAIVAKATVELPDPQDVDAAEAQSKELAELFRQAGEARSRLQQTLLAANRKTDVLKAAAEKKRRWRMYQVWRVIDADGYTDWTPKTNHRTEYAIKEVGQVINFAANSDTLNMCRGGTHNARFAREAVGTYLGDRLVRLELEGWVDRQQYFQCEQAKVLAIIDMPTLMGLPNTPAFVEDSRSRALLRFFEPDHASYIDPHGGSTTNLDHWRQLFLNEYFRPIVAKIEANETYQPTQMELVNLFCVAEKAQLNHHLFSMSLNTLVDAPSLQVYFERVVNKSRQERAAAAGVSGRRGDASPAQRAMQNKDHKTLEVHVRKYVADNLPGVVIKDFGVSRGRDALDPHSTSSPKYWLDD